MSKLTSIYLVRRGDFVKIGKADCPLSRFDALQTASPTPLAMLGCIEADASEEKRLHERFAAHRVNGEWFRWCDEIAAFADTLTHRPPPPRIKTPPAGRRKKMVTLTLDPKVVDRLKAWIARQEMPPAQNAVIARAITSYLDEVGG